MGGERRSTVHQRENGRICARCGNLLGPAPPGYRPGYGVGERLCTACSPKPHRLYMRFRREGDLWIVAVQEKGGRRAILRTSRFADPDLVMKMARAGNAFTDLAARQAVEYALGNLPEGLTELHLTDEQLAWLRTGRNPPHAPKVEM